ncbi:MAG: SGNH/GDSL hydrolase family protein, partial [Bacteroidales bacterium]|nr:SGNH/GDSL hydrolase family protein [Bacteroidales bacterium]
MKRKILNILVFIFGILSVGIGQITVNTNFTPNISGHIDSRCVLTNLADTSTIAFKYEGMLIYVAVPNKFYYYETYWKELASEDLIDGYVSDNGYLTGIGTTNYLPVWGSASYLTYSSGTGFVKVTNGNISYDNSTYLTSEVDGSTSNEIQRLDTFEIYETNKLRISLQNDGEPFKTITLPAGSDTQDLSLDSLSRVFTLTLTNGGTVKWKDIDTNSGGTVTGVTAATPLTSTGGTAPEIGITLLKDLVIQPPLSGGSYNNILPGSDSDVLIGVDTTSAITGLVTKWQLSQLSFADTQDLSLDSLNRVFTINLTNGGSIKFKDTDTNSGGTVTNIASGNGMNFTTITGTGTVTMGTPSTLTASTTNAVTTTSHTHAVTGFLTNEVDGSTTNELQTIALDSTATTIGLTTSINSNRVHFNVLKSEIDGSITNEIQKLDTFEIYETNKLRISLQGDNEIFKTVTLPAGSDTQDLSLDSLNRVFSLALVNGGSVKWKDSDSELPTQTGNNGKYLQTNGTAPSWQTAISGTASSNYLPVGSGATSITTSSGTGFVKVTNGDISYDNSTYGTGTVTGVSGTNPVVSSGGATPAISINSDTLTSWRSKQNQGVIGYNDKINSLAVSGTTTKTITLTQQDGGTVSNTFTDIDTDTQLSAEQVQDYIGAMVTGNTENNMNVDYQDSDGTIDFNITMDKDIVASAPLSGGANNVLIGNDSDVTISADTTSSAGLATQDDIKSKLKGQNWVLFGDSFSDGITGEYGAVVRTLLSLGTVSTLAVTGHKMSQQLAVLDATLGSNPNYFDSYNIASLLCGINDFAANTALGNRSSSIGSSTYAGYLKDYIETLLSASPEIKLYVMTPPEANGAGVTYNATNTAGWKVKDMAVLINQICSDYAIQCIDL